MTAPDACPECGSGEIQETTRTTALHGHIRAFVCGACHWTSDLRIGRPPADRSKNVTLRRLLGAASPKDQGGEQQG
ncbi:MAG: hypothetical protein HY240_11170 [Actinobacteria bacterium]|nr:hypothetical protein [Actinomycetota bacterium]